MKTVLQFLEENNYTMSIEDNCAILFDRHGKRCIFVDIRYGLVQTSESYMVNVEIISELCKLLKDKLAK